MLIFQLGIQALSCVELPLVSAGSAKEKRFGACALLVDVPLPADLQDAMGGPWRFRWDITISHGHRTWFEGLSCGSCHPRKSGFRVDILRCCWGRCFSTQDPVVFWVLEAAVANCSSVHLIVDRTVTRVDCVGWFTPFSEDLEGFCCCCRWWDQEREGGAGWRPAPRVHLAGWCQSSSAAFLRVNKQNFGEKKYHRPRVTRTKWKREEFP